MGTATANERGHAGSVAPVLTMDALSMLLSAMLNSGRPQPAVAAQPAPVVAQAPGNPYGAPSAPGISITMVGVPNAFYCMSRAQVAIYSVGAGDIRQDNDSFGGSVGGSNRVLIWCRGSEAAIIAAGPSAQQLTQQLRTSF